MLVGHRHARSVFSARVWMTLLRSWMRASIIIIMDRLETMHVGALYPWRDQATRVVRMYVCGYTDSRMHSANGPCIGIARVHRQSASPCTARGSMGQAWWTE